MELIDLAERRGNSRLVANHQQVLNNLDNIITTLAAFEETGPSQ